MLKDVFSEAHFLGDQESNICLSFLLCQNFFSSNLYGAIEKESLASYWTIMKMKRKETSNDIIAGNSRILSQNM